MQKRMVVTLTIVMLALFSVYGFGQSINLADWKVLSEENKTVPLTDTIFQDKSCVKLDGSIKSAIWNPMADFRNFRLEVDIAGSVMSGIGFHAANEQNYQFLYFRPGYGGTEEAIQYIPIYNGALSWVMYGKYQSNADIKKLQWFHAVIEVRGNNLAVFTNYNKTPDMNITMLGSSADRGSIMLRTMFGASYFANLTVRELPDVITDWEISEQLAVDMPYEYSQVKKVKNWTKINERGDDYVNICRYFKYPNGTIIARHNLHSDTNEVKFLNFDFAGRLHILLNGREIFSYDKYKLDRIDPGTNRIMLELKKGDNELILISGGDGYIFGKGYNSLGRLQHQNWGFISSIGK